MIPEKGIPGVEQRRLRRCEGGQDCLVTYAERRPLDGMMGRRGDVPLDEAIHIMMEKHIRFLVVTEEGPEGRTPVGVLSTTDVIRHLVGPRWTWYHPESALTARPRLRVRSDRGTRN